MIELSISIPQLVWAAGAILAVFTFLLCLGYVMGNHKAPTAPKPESPTVSEIYEEGDTGYIQDEIYDPEEADVRVPTVRQ